MTGLLPRRADLAEMLRHPRRDVVAGLTTGIVALPLALAFGVASGMGARAGMVTAIVAGALAAVFGGSRVQVSGPTGAMAVVLLPAAAAYGSGGVLVAGLLAGLLLVAAAALRLGRYVAFLPLPVVEGFTAGIAAVIALQQVPVALGVEAEGERTIAVAARAVWQWLGHPSYATAGLALGVAAVMLTARRVHAALPSSLVAVAAATAAADLLGLDVARIGRLPSSMPAPSLPDVPWHALGALVPTALAIAALAGIESLLAATVADGLTGGERHDANRELFGQGVANVVVPLLGGMPATGAIARTAVSIRAGAATRLAAVVHSLVLLGCVLALSSWVGRVPLAALAGVLLVTAARMVDRHGIATLARTGRGAAAVLAATFVATVALDLVKAVEIGVATACVLALHQVARAARLDRVEPGGEPYAVHDLIDQHVVVFRIDGSLFFATAHRLLAELLDVADVRAVVVRLGGVRVLDATGARMLADAVAGLEARGVTVLLAEVRRQHADLLASLGVVASLRHEGHLFADAAQAVAHAREHVAAVPAR